MLRRQGIPPDFEGLPQLIDALVERLRGIWGEDDPEVASEHRYVKYSNAYEARAIVDFDEGWVQVETVAEEDPLGKLRDAIVESAFNPYAISPANAYGLMQVVPSTAGRDVYQRVKKQAG